MLQKDNFNRFQKFLNEAEGEFHILEHQVPIETQMEYFKYSNRLRSHRRPEKSELVVNEREFEQFVSDLQNPATPTDDKKRILAALAVSKQVKAYRILENYLQTVDKELTDWAFMALMESRIVLESEFTDEKLIYISTGLGGKGKKLRFYVLLLSNTGQPFLDYQQKVVEREFAYTLAKEDGEIEQLIFKMNYIEMLILVPFHANITKILEHVINECNQYGDFVSNTVTLTNVKKLSDNEITQIINKHDKKSKNIRTSH